MAACVGNESINVTPVDELTIPTIQDLDFSLKNFNELSIPDPVDIIVTPFVGLEPVAPTKIIADTLFLYEVFSMLVQDVIDGKIGDLLDYITPFDIEQLEFNRAKEELSDETEEVIEELFEDEGSRNFLAPSGPTQRAVSRASLRIKQRASRINQALYEQKGEITRANIDFGFKAGNEAERIVRATDEQRQSVNLQAVQLLVEVDFGVFEVELNRHNARLQVKRIKHSAWIDEHKGKLLELQAIEAKIDGVILTKDEEKLRLDLQALAIDYLISQQDLKQTNLDLFTIEALREENKLRTFKAEIDKFESILNLNISKFNLYKTEIQLEVSKVDIYEAKVRATEAKLRAQVAVTRSNRIVGDSRITVARASLDVQEEKLRAVRIRLDNSILNARQIAQGFNTHLITYQATLLRWLNTCRDITLVQMENERVDSETSVQSAEVSGDSAVIVQTTDDKTTAISDIATLNNEIRTALATIQSQSNIASELIHTYTQG